MGLILPGDPLFDYTLATTPPPDARGQVSICRYDSGVLEAVDPDSAALADYLYGGEYDARLEAINDPLDYSDWVTAEELLSGTIDEEFRNSERFKELAVLPPG